MKEDKDLKADEKYQKLKKEFDDMHDKYVAARDAAIKHAELAAALSGNKAMRLYRKAQVKSGKDDPFEMLRPRLSQAESGIVSNIDSVSYKKGDIAIRGWAFDMKGVVPPIMVRDRSRILRFGQNRYPRADVNDELKLPMDFCSGFYIRVPLSDIHHPKITVEFENEFGYVAKEVEVLLNEKERQTYIDKGAAPTYCSDNAGYDEWIHEHLVKEDELEREKAATFQYSPLVSILVPLYNTPKIFLEELMDSLLQQSYNNIEICLADGSTEEEPGQIIKEKYASDSRVVYKRLDKNTGISGNTNEAIKMAHGDFLLLSDHDDTLEKNAVYEIVKALNKNPEGDVVYTDEDKTMLTGGVYYSPNFKPDYNPDLLTSNNYITHIFCVRKSIVDEVGGEDSDYDGAQDYDFILRCCEKARAVLHVPMILYHWRAHQSSTAGNPESKMYAYENGRRAIEAHYRRVGIPAKVSLAADIGSYRSVYEIQGEPLVSIIIPNKDFSKVLERALASIFQKSTYKNYEIIIAENNSKEPETFRFYEKLQNEHKNVHVVTWKGEFNYSAINNFAVKSAKGEYLLFLNNDVEVITERWIEEMLGFCQRPDVGACGVRLYYPNNKLQHCGIVVGIGGIAGHICHLEKRESGGYFGRVTKTQDVSAVTAACMMTPRKVYEEVGGMDEAYEVAYNDVDYCLKVREKGLLVVYNSWAMLYHYESLSRGSDEEEDNPKKHSRQLEEAKRLRSRWPEIYRDGDPYFNPNLDYCTSDFILKGTIPPNYTVLQKTEQEVKDDSE
ncbi:MAG TPA: glycosyltransferase family 2 protein [Lachnospiraceae bacterium]|nr:glycosyltransferase family 2 protein [Lachnospiraceae bacterium]